jgi:hypothetical protein
MIKTLHITGAAAVILAVVVVASVLGFRRPVSLLHLNFGPRGDKQVDKILSGSSAVDRFKELHKGKVPNEGDATPPLVKEAERFANILNPPVVAEAPAVAPTNLPQKPTITKPPVAVSSKFDLVGICYSSDAKTSLAYIRLPDNTYQWVGQGSEIGHVTLKEIRKGSVVCWDGRRNSEMLVESTRDPSSLLETGASPATPVTPLPRPTVGTKASNGPVKPHAAMNLATIPAAPAPSAQISKEEQQALGDLGNRLKAGTGSAGADSAERDKLIAEYKSARAGVQEGEKPANPSEQAPLDAGKDAARDSMKEGSRRAFMKKLSMPRSAPK